MMSSTEEEVQNYFTSPEFLAREKRRQEITAELMEQNGMPYMTAVIVAGDIVSAEEATERVNNGADPKEEYRHIGSYARFDWCVKNLPKDFLLKMLPELWVAADPNDTNPEYLELWKRAYAFNGNKTVQDNKRKKLPKGKLKVFRGQIGDVWGMAWTLDLDIAKKFAITGGGRAPVPGGKVFKADVNAKHVLAYLTERGESELIIDPKNLSNIHISHTVQERT